MKHARFVIWGLAATLFLLLTAPLLTLRAAPPVCYDIFTDLIIPCPEAPPAKNDDIYSDKKTTVALMGTTLSIYSDKKTSAGDSGTTNGMLIGDVLGWGTPSQSVSFSSSGDTGKVAASDAGAAREGWAYQLTKNADGSYTLTIYKGDTVIDSTMVTFETTPYLPSQDVAAQDVAAQAPVEKCPAERLAKAVADATANATNANAAADATAKVADAAAKVATEAASLVMASDPYKVADAAAKVAKVATKVATATVGTNGTAADATDLAAAYTTTANAYTAKVATVRAKVDNAYFISAAAYTAAADAYTAAAAAYTATANAYIANAAATDAQATYETCLKSQPQ